MADGRPKDYDLDSPNGVFHARVEFGRETPSVLSSGYGKPYYPTTVTVTVTAELSKKLVVWKEDSERTQVTFSEDSRHLEVLWEIAGCMLNSSGVRHFRDVFHLPSGVEVVSASSDFRKDNETASCPNPVGSKASVHLAQMLRTMLWESYKQWEQLPNLPELTAFLNIIAESGVDISGSSGAVRYLVSLLCRDLGSWSNDEVRFRLAIVKILNRVSVGSSKEFIDLLIPRGRIREPVRDEHNRLADEFGRKLIDADLPAHRDALRKTLSEMLSGSEEVAPDGAFGFIELLYPQPDEAAAVCRQMVAVAQARVAALEQAVLQRLGSAEPAAPGTILRGDVTG